MKHKQPTAALKTKHIKKNYEDFIDRMRFAQLTDIKDGKMHREIYYKTRYLRPPMPVTKIIGKFQEVVFTLTAEVF